MVRYVALAAGLLILALLAYVSVVRQPSNDRDWEFGMATLPSASFEGDTVHLRNVRDFHWTPDGGATPAYVDRSVSPDHLERVWFVEEPFALEPFSSFEAVAHTYFVFDFTDQPPLALSVEARRERGETFDIVKGLLNDFELIYIWGTEQDVTGRRAIVEHNRLYMYPLTIPLESARALLLQLAQTSGDLETHPRFYNSLTSNCTNELARVANLVQSDAIPNDIALIFPGYSDELLYRLGFVPTNVSLPQLRENVFVTDEVAADLNDPDFSARLREALPRRG
jgi:hypothetical protein